MKNLYFLFFILFGTFASAQNDSLVINVYTSADIDQDCTGSASVSIESGVGPFTYSWSAGITPQGTEAFNLCSGSYYVTVADGLGNMGTYNFIIEDSSTTVATVSTAPSQNNACSGSAIVTVVEGLAPFQFVWDETVVTTTNEKFDLCAGNHLVAVVNGTYDTLFIPFTITDSTVAGDPMVVSVVPIPAFEFCDGSAVAYVTGGTPPYSYAWQNASSLDTQTVTDLCPGTYLLMVTDNQGVMGNAVFTIVDSTNQGPVNGDSTLQIAITTVDDLTGNCTGSASLEILGGVPPFEHFWSTGWQQNGLSTENVCAGIYSLTVLAGNGDSITQFFVIADSAMIFGTDNFQDSVVEGYLGGNTIANCDLIYPDIDSAAVTNISPFSAGLLLVEWTVYANGTSITIYDTVSYTGDYGIYEISLTIYCPGKSTGNFAKLHDRVLINEFLAVNDNALLAVSVYPNPFESKINISAESGNYIVTMYDQTGRIVAKQAYTNVSDMIFEAPAELNAGVYLLNISNGTTSVMKRLLK